MIIEYLEQTCNFTLQISLKGGGGGGGGGKQVSFISLFSH